MENDIYGVGRLKKRHPVPVKIIAIAIIISFVHFDIVWAQNLSVSTPKTVQNLPYKFARPGEAYINGSKELLFNIQDAHASLSAQNSITELLQFLTTEYNLELIAVEGSEGYVNTNILRTFPVDSVKKKIGTELMREGRMSAGEFFSIISEKPIALYGIDDDTLYKKNLEVFRRVMSGNGEAIKSLEIFKKALKELRGRIYPAALLDLQEKSEKHRKKEVSFTDYWAYVSRLAVDKGLAGNIKEAKDVSLLLQALRLEKEIDFEKANSQRDRLIDLLTKKMSKPSLEALVSKTLLFKKGDIPQHEFYGFLVSLAEREKIDKDAYNILAKFTLYLSLYESIDMFKLFDQIGSLEDVLMESLLDTPDQRELFFMEKTADIITTLFKFNLTGKEVDYLMKNKGRMSEIAFLDFLRTRFKKYNLAVPKGLDMSFVSGMDEALGFYDIARERNDAMFRNTLLRMKKENKHVAALVTGGFHTSGLTEIMKKKNLSYLVICPKFDGTEERPYVAVLTDKKGPYEKLVDSGNYNLAVYQYFSGALSLEEMKELARKSLKEAVDNGDDPKDLKRRWSAQFRKAEAAISDPEKRNRVTPDEFDRMLAEIDASQAGPARINPVSETNLRKNIDLFRDNLDPTKPFNGHDVIILGSNDQAEADYQEKILESVFGDRITQSGRKVMILSVAKDWAGLDENFQTPMFTFFGQAAKRAKEKYGIDLMEYWKSGASIGLYPHYGTGSRDNPITISEDNSRGSQSIIGKVKTRDGAEIPLSLIVAVIANNGLLAEGSMLDVLWVSQLYFGSNAKEETSKVRHLFAKHAKAQNKDNLSNINGQSVVQFSMYEGDGDLNAVGIQPYARGVTKDKMPQEVEKRREWAKSVPRALYDLGSHRFSYELYEKIHKGLYNIARAKSDSGETINLDTGFANPLMTLVSLLRKVKDIDSITTLGGLRSAVTEDEWKALEKADKDFMITNFYLQNKGLSPSGINGWFGLTDIGSDSYWWAYRTPGETYRQHMIMISSDDKAEQEDMRRIHGIKHPISKSIIGDVYVEGPEYTFEDVERGVDIGGVHVEKSIIQNSHIVQGSKVRGSILEDYIGACDVSDILAVNSTVNLTGENAMVLNAVAGSPIALNKKDVVAGVYRPSISDPGYPAGQTIIKASFDDDNRDKATDENAIHGNRYSYKAIREMPCNYYENSRIKESLEAGHIPALAQRNLEVFNNMVKAGTLTKEAASYLAKNASSHFWKYLNSRPEHPETAAPDALRPDIELLTRMACLDNPDLRQYGISELFGSVVEGLCDSFLEKNRLTYYRVFAQVIDICRRLPEGKRLDGLLNDFGIRDEKGLVTRNMSVRKPHTLSAADKSKIKRIIVPSRVTYGADVSVTSVAIETAKKAFPNLEDKGIVLFANEDFKYFFGGDPKIDIAELKYNRRGSLIERLDSWNALLEAIKDKTRGLDDDEWIVIDPDSRLTQVGMLPVVKDESRYFFFDGSVNDDVESAPEKSTSIGEDIRAWANSCFGPFRDIDSVKCKVSLLAEDVDFARRVINNLNLKEKHTVTYKVGVGDNNDKRLSDEFEHDLTRSLIERNKATIILHSSTGNERERAKAIYDRMVKEGKKGIIVYEDRPIPQTDTPPDIVLFWGDRNSIGKYNALIQESGQYIGYDSMGQHVAAAVGTPAIIIFAGYKVRWFPGRWTPLGVNDVFVIKVENMFIPKWQIDEGKIVEEVLLRTAQLAQGPHKIRPPPAATPPIVKRAPGTEPPSSAEWQNIRNSSKKYVTEDIPQEVTRFMIKCLTPRGTKIPDIKKLQKIASDGKAAKNRMALAGLQKKLDRIFKANPEYRTFFHLLLFDRIKIKVDDMRDEEAGRPLLLYPREKQKDGEKEEDYEIPGIVAWTEEGSETDDKDKSCYIHVTKAFWQSIRKRKNWVEILSQCLAHEHRERYGSDSIHRSAHSIASADELIFSSQDAKKKGVSDLNLFFLNYAASEKNGYYLYDVLWRAYDPAKDPSGHFKKQLVEAILSIKDKELLRSILIKCITSYYPHKDPGGYYKNRFLREVETINRKLGKSIEGPADLLIWYRIKLELENRSIEDISDEIDTMLRNKSLDEKFVKSAFIKYVPIAKRKYENGKKNVYKNLLEAGVPQENFYTTRDHVYLPQISIPFDGDSGFTAIKCPYNKDAVSELTARMGQPETRKLTVEELLSSVLDRGELMETYNAARAMRESLQQGDRDGNYEGRRFIGTYNVSDLQEVAEGLKLSVYSEEFVNMVVSEILIKHKIRGGPIIVNIIAAGGAGKTTLCEMIKSALESPSKKLKVVTSSTDDYLMNRAFRRETGDEGMSVMQGPGMYMSKELLLATIRDVKQGKSVLLPRRDNSGKTILYDKPCDKPDVFILEGVMSGHGQLASEIDISIGISEEFDDRRLDVKVERDLLPKSKGGRLDKEGYVLKDFARKQFEEQKDTIANDIFDGADYVWRFDPQDQDKNVAFVRKDSRNLTYGRVVAQFGEEPVATKGAIDKIRQLYPHYDDAMAILRLFDIYVAKRFPPEIDFISQEDIENPQKTNMPQVIVATMANNIVDMTKGSELKEVDSDVADLLIKYLGGGGILIVISGTGKDDIQKCLLDVLIKRVREENKNKPAKERLSEEQVKNVLAKLLERIILCPCSGAEVLRYDAEEEKLPDKEKKDYRYRIAKKLTPKQRNAWERIVKEAIEKFMLKEPLILPNMPIDKLPVTIHDRGDLFVFEMVNRAGLTKEQAEALNERLRKDGVKELIDIDNAEQKSYDLRDAVMKYLTKRVNEEKLPIITKKASLSGLDMFIESTDPSMTLREAALKKIRDERIIESILKLKSPSQVIDEKHILIAARYYPDIRKVFRSSSYIIFYPELTTRSENGPKLFVGLPFSRGFKQFLTALLKRKTMSNADFLGTTIPHVGTDDVLGVNDVLSDPRTAHSRIENSEEQAIKDSVKKFLTSQNVMVDPNLLKAFGMTEAEDFWSKLRIELAEPNDNRAPPGFLGLIYNSPSEYQYVHAGWGEDKKTPTVHISAKLYNHIKNINQAEHAVAYSIHEVLHLLGYAHEFAESMHKKYLALLGRSAKEADDLLKNLTERAVASEIIYKLSPVAEKIARHKGIPDLDEIIAGAEGLEIDRLNIVKLENGFVIIPVNLSGEWHYVMYRNTGELLIPKDIAGAMKDESNWLESSGDLKGIVFDGVEALLVTKRVADSIITKSAFDKEYNAIWTDWDGTVTPAKLQPGETPKPNTEVLKKLIESHKKGVSLAFGTRRRRSKSEELRQELLNAGAVEEDLNGIHAYFENGAYGIDLGTGKLLYSSKDLSSRDRRKVSRLLRKYRKDPKVEKIDTDAGDSRILVILKSNEDMKDYLETLNTALIKINDGTDNKLKAIVDSGSSSPRIAIMRDDVDKTGGLSQFSASTGVVIPKIAKFGDQGHSGQYEIQKGLERKLFEGNDWPVLKLEGSFSVDKRDISAVFPVVSDKKNDAGMLELLDRLNIVPPSAADGLKQKVLASFYRAWNKTKQNLFRSGSYGYEIEKIKKAVARAFWVNQATGVTTLIAVHGPAGSGKTTTAYAVRDDLWKYLGIKGSIFSIDDWLYQRGCRPKTPDGKTIKFRMDIFKQNMRDLKASKLEADIVKPMFDNDTTGTLLFARTPKGEIILHNGERALVIGMAGKTIEEWKTDLESGKFRDKLETKSAGAGGVWHGVCGSTGIEVEFDKDGQKVRVAIRGNNHFIKNEGEGLKLIRPDGAEVALQIGFKGAVEAQEVVEPGGLVIIEGTRVMNDEALGGYAEGEQFVKKGVYDETIEFKAPFEVRRIRAIRRTESRDKPLSDVDREGQEFENKQKESEPESLAAGMRARIHIDLQTVPEAIWDKYKCGMILSVGNELDDVLGVTPEGLQARLDNIARERIVQVVLDEVAKDGSLGYPAKDKDMQARKERFNNPHSPHITLQAGFLEIKLAKSTLEKDTVGLDEELIAKYEQIKERARDLMDPGEIVDLSSAGRIFLNLGDEKDNKPVKLGKVLVQNHISWLEDSLAERIKKGKIEKARRLIDGFFDVQREMWERGIIDGSPDITWRYGTIVIRDEERVVATSPSRLEVGEKALADFNPEKYWSKDTEKRLKAISESLWKYYKEQVILKILLPLGYSGFSDFNKDESRKARDLNRARRLLRSNFFEKRIKEEKRAAAPKEKKGRAAVSRTTSIGGTESSFRNIGLSHPYVDAAQVDYVHELTLIHMLKVLKEEYLPLLGDEPSPILWARLVIEAQKSDPINDFSILMTEFYKLLEDDPRLLDKIEDNDMLNDMVYGRYESRFFAKKREAPLIGDYAWGAFNFFIEEARSIKTPKPVISNIDRIKEMRKDDARRQLKAAIDSGREAVVRVYQGSSPRPMAIVSDWSGMLKRRSGINPVFYNKILGLPENDKKGKEIDGWNSMRGISIVERIEMVRDMALKNGLSPKSVDELMDDLTKMSVERIDRLKAKNEVNNWLEPGAKRFIEAACRLLKGKKRAFFIYTAKPESMFRAEAAASGFSDFDPDNVYSLRLSSNDVGYSTKMVPIMKIAREKVKKIADRIVVMDDTPRGIREASVTGALTVGFVGTDGTKEERKERASKLIDAGADVVITGFDGVPLDELLNSIGFRAATKRYVDMESYIEEGPIYLKRLSGPSGLPAEFKVWGWPAEKVSDALGTKISVSEDKKEKAIGTITFACGLSDNTYTSMASTPYGDIPFDRLVKEHPEAVLGDDKGDAYPFYMKYLFLNGEPVIWIGIKEGYEIDEVIQGLRDLANRRDADKQLYDNALAQGKKIMAEGILKAYLDAVNAFCNKYFNRIDVDREPTSTYIAAGIVHAAGTGLSIQIHDPYDPVGQKDELWMTGPDFVKDGAGFKGFRILEPQQVSNLTYQIVLRDLNRPFDEAGFEKGLEILKSTDGQFPRGEKLLKYLSDYPNEKRKFAFDVITLKPGEPKEIVSSKDGPQTIFVHKGELSVKDPRDGAEHALVAPDALIMPCRSPGIRLQNNGYDPAVLLRVYLPATGPRAPPVSTPDAKRAPGTTPPSREEWQKIKELISKQSGQKEEEIGQNVVDFLQDRIDLKISLQESYKELLHLLKVKRIKFRIDPAKDEKGAGLLLYPRFGKNEESMGSVSWIDIEKEVSYIHLTAAFWEKYRNSKEILAQIVAHEFRDNLYHDDVFSKSAHHAAVRDELEFSSDEARIRGVSDLNQFYLDHANIHGQKDYLLMLWNDYDPARDLNKSFQRALIKAIINFKEINKGDRQDLLYSCLDTYDPEKDSTKVVKDRLLEEINKLNNESGIGIARPITSVRDFRVWYRIQVEYTGADMTGIDEKGRDKITGRIDEMLKKGLVSRELVDKCLIKYTPQYGFRNTGYDEEHIADDKNRSDKVKKDKGIYLDKQKSYNDGDYVYVPRAPIDTPQEDFIPVNCSYDRVEMERLEELKKAFPEEIDKLLKAISESDNFSPTVKTIAARIMSLRHGGKHLYADSSIDSPKSVASLMEIAVKSRTFIDRIVGHIIAKFYSEGRKPIFMNIIAAGGAGKTTMATNIETVLASMELAVLQKSADDYLWSGDFRKKALQREGKDVMAGSGMYDAKQHLLSDVRALKDREYVVGGRSIDIFILEGCLSGHGELKKMVDLSIGLKEVSEENRLKRKMARDTDPEGKRKQTEGETIKDFRHKQFHEETDTIGRDILARADFVWRFDEERVYLKTDSREFILQELIKLFSGEEAIVRREADKLMTLYPNLSEREAEIELARQWLSKEIPSDIRILVRSESDKRSADGGVRDMAVTELKIPGAIVTSLAHTLVWLGAGYRVKEGDKKLYENINRYLTLGGVLVIVTGWDKDQIDKVTSHIKPELRSRVIVASCFGANIYGYDNNGKEINRLSRIGELSEAERNTLFKIADEVYDIYGLGEPLLDLRGRMIDNLVPYERRLVAAAFEIDGRKELPVDVVSRINERLKERGVSLRYRISTKTDVSKSVPSANGEKINFYDLRIAIKRYVNMRLKQEKVNNKVEGRLTGTGGLNITLKALDYKTAVSSIRDAKLIEQIAGGEKMAEEDIIVLGSSFVKAFPKATHVTFQAERLLKGDSTLKKKVMLYYGSPGPNGAAEFLDELLRGIEPRKKYVSDIIKNIEQSLAGNIDSSGIKANLQALITGSGITAQDQWFYSRLVRLVGMEDSRRPKGAAKRYYPRTPLTEEQQRLLNTVTPVYEFDKDDTLDESSTSLSETSARRLARLIASGKKVGVNTAKALKELKDKKCELYEPLREALVTIMRQEGWGNDAVNAADDLLCDLFELFMDTAATRMTPVRGARTQNELVPDINFQAAFKEDVVAKIKESLEGDKIDSRLKKVIEGERDRLVREGYADYAGVEPKLNIYGMPLDDPRFVTKLEYYPFAPVAIKKDKEPEKFASNELARTRVAEILEKIFEEMGIGKHPQSGNYGILPVASGSRSVDLNMLLPDGNRIQKDRGIRYEFELGYRNIYYFDNEAHKGNGRAVTDYCIELHKNPGKDKNLTVYDVDHNKPSDAERESLEKQGVVYLGEGIKGTAKFLDNEMSKAEVSKKIMIGVPVKDLDGHAKQELLARIRKAAGKDATIVELEGTTEDNFALLNQRAKESGALRLGILDTALKQEELETIVGQFIDRAAADIFYLTHKEGVKAASLTDLQEACSIAQPIVSLDLDRKSIYEFEKAAISVYSKKAELCQVSPEATKALVTLKESGKFKYVIWTSELEKKGLPFTADIRQRRDSLGAAKETDPIRDILVITDPKIVNEIDPKAKEEMIRKYLEKKGLDEAISASQVVCLDKNNSISIAKVYERLCQAYGKIDIKDIAIGAIEGEFQYDDFGRQFKVLNLQAAADSNIGMYKLMVEALAIDDGKPSQFLKEDSERKGWYLYLPPALPMDYEKLYKKYKLYIEEVLYKA